MGREALDQWFGYLTPVYVHVLDVRLGVLRYLLLIAIAAYVIVYNLIYGTQYVKAEPPVGTVRFSFRMPTRSISGTHGCDTLKPGCFADFRNLTELPYCSQGQPADAITVLPCTYEDELAAVWVNGFSALLTTSVREYEQQRACPAGSDACSQLWSAADGSGSGSTVRFLADVERYTVVLDHSAIAPTLGIYGTSRDYAGPLETASPALCATHPNRSGHLPTAAWPAVPSSGPPCYVMPNQTVPPSGFDVFEVSTLLEAAGLALDGRSQVQGSDNNSLRFEGSIVVISIRYVNYRPWVGLLPTVAYSYRVQAMPTSSAKQVEALITRFPDLRVVRNYHGIQFFIVQTGSLGRFEVLSLLLTLTAALTMLAVANFLVDSVALYLLPERGNFQRVKYPQARLGSPGQAEPLEESTDDSENDGARSGGRLRGREEEHDLRSG